MNLDKAFENVKNETATFHELVSVICGRNIDNLFIEGAYELSRYQEQSLIQSGFTEEEARRIRAAFELIAQAEVGSCKPEFIRNSDDLIPWIMLHANTIEQEYYGVVALDKENKTLDMKIILSSKDDGSFPTHEMLRFAVSHGAAKVIIFHGSSLFDCIPKDEDIKITENLKMACNLLLNAELIDHIIVGKRNYISLKEKYYF